MQTPPWDLANSLKTRPELKWASRLISARLFQGRKFSENVLLGVEVQLLPAFLGAAPRAAAALPHLPDLQQQRRYCGDGLVQVILFRVFVEHTVQSLTELDKLSLEM